MHQTMPISERTRKKRLMMVSSRLFFLGSMRRGLGFSFRSLLPLA